MTERNMALEVRAMVEATMRLRELLHARRCIVCAQALTETNPATLTLYDLAICSKPKCAAMILDAPIGDLDDGLPYRAQRVAGPAGRPPYGAWHAVREGWTSALCGRRPHEGGIGSRSGVVR